MSMNWVEIHQVLQELNLEGAILQSVRQQAFRCFYFDFYRTEGHVTLLISLEPGRTRLHPVTQMPVGKAPVLRWTQFVKAHLVGKRLLSVGQHGQERLVEFRFAGPEGELALMVRLWSGAGNLFVVEKGIILEAAFRRPASGEVSGGPWEFPSSRPTEKVFSLRDLPGQGTYGERLAAFYGQGVDLEALRTRLTQAWERRLASWEQQKKRLEERLTQGERQTDYQAWGDFITSYAWQINPGAKELQVTDWRDNNLVILKLEPHLTPFENAQVWYKKARKVREAAELAHQELPQVVAGIKACQLRLEQIAQADDQALPELEKQSKEALKNNTPPAVTGRPGVEFTSGDFRILVGRNARESDELFRHWSKGSDWWMHTRDVPGGFVFLRGPRGKSIPLEVLLDAGTLAIWYSKAKAELEADLYYTQAKYLRRLKKGPPGKVIPSQEKNLHVKVDPLRLKRLLKLD